MMFSAIWFLYRGQQGELKGKTRILSWQIKRIFPSVSIPDAPSSCIESLPRSFSKKKVENQANKQSSRNITSWSNVKYSLLGQVVSSDQEYIQYNLTFHAIPKVLLICSIVALPCALRCDNFTHIQTQHEKPIDEWSLKVQTHWVPGEGTQPHWRQHQRPGHSGSEKNWK